MAKITMRDVRLASLLSMETVCGKVDVPQELHDRIMMLQEKLHRQIMHDLGLADSPGAFSMIPDSIVLSEKAGNTLKELAAALGSQPALSR